MTIMPDVVTLDFSASVSPNIFDVLCNSNLIAPLLLANLLSPERWILSEKIYSKYSHSAGLKQRLSRVFILFTLNYFY